MVLAWLESGVPAPPEEEQPDEATKADKVTRATP